MDRSDVIARAFRVCGRACLGAIPGFIVAILGAWLGFSFFPQSPFTDHPKDAPAFWIVVGSGTTAFALIAAVFGAVEIRGKFGAAIKGAVAGALLGIPSGALAGNILGGKFGIAPGLFLVGILATILGGYLGATLHKNPAPPILSPGVAAKPKPVGKGLADDF